MWEELLYESGLNEREVNSIMILGNNPKMKASELAKELKTTRLDAYNSLSRLQEMGIVTVTADRPMLFSSMNVLESRDLAMNVAEEFVKASEALNINYIFKGSYDKANRSSIDSFRGPGIDQGLKILKTVKDEFNVPIISDIHV